KSMDGTESAELIPNGKVAVKHFIGANELCLTGAGFEILSNEHPNFLKVIIADVRVFARMSPKQKERVVNLLKSLGYITLMCGDGTNDVGALKHSNVGVALLSHPYNANKPKVEEIKEGNDTTNAAANQPKLPVQAVAHRRGAPRQIDNRVQRHQASVQNAQERLEKM
uniref:Uncharacterized protein n=1 Tax=Panagrolaimus sp. PS1159 TaxID=55785 RepID=A0AC35FB93_9BILA